MDASVLQYDVIVVGGGPGGIGAAVAAAVMLAAEDVAVHAAVPFVAFGLAEHSKQTFQNLFRRGR